MNLVGKIFVVLIFVASIVFMTMGMMVYATHQNFDKAITDTKAKDGHSGWKEQLTDAYAESAKLHNDNNKLQEQIIAINAAHLQALTKTENERDVLAKRATDLGEEVKKEAVRLDEAAKGLQVAQQNLTDLRKENVALREDIRNANKQTDDQLKLATQAEDKLNIANGLLADLKKRNEQIASDFAKANVLLRGMGMTYLDPPNKQPPMIRGQITAIDKEDRVEISLGSDDGLREGHTLEVYRGNKYLGRMQVLEAQPHRAIGMILKDYKQEAIRTGDEVATRLKA